MRCTLLLAFLVIFATTGCHSAYIEATIRNTTGHPITLVELDYPSASFGTQSLPSGQDFHYRFKVLNSGDVKLLWTNPGNQDQKASGPNLQEGDEGTLVVIVTPNGAQWTPNLHRR